MTISEAKDILVDRIGWDDDLTLTGFVVTAPASTTDSGRFFQDEHNAITLENIKDTQSILDISDAAFNTLLQKLTIRAVNKVLADAFEKDFINDDLLTAYPAGFDNAISLQMTILVSELIISSTRSNRIERLTDDFVGKLNYDIFREAPNKFAIRGANYNYTLGVATRYGFEIRSVQRRFGSQRNLLKTVTKGEVITDMGYLDYTNVQDKYGN